MPSITVSKSQSTVLLISRLGARSRKRTRCIKWDLNIAVSSSARNHSDPFKLPTLKPLRTSIIHRVDEDIPTVERNFSRNYEQTASGIITWFAWKNSQFSMAHEIAAFRESLDSRLLEETPSISFFLSFCFYLKLKSRIVSRSRKHVCTCLCVTFCKLLTMQRNTRECN